MGPKVREACLSLRSSQCPETGCVWDRKGLGTQDPQDGSTGVPVAWLGALSSSEQEGPLTGSWQHMEVECWPWRGQRVAQKVAEKWWHPPSTSRLTWAGLQAPLSLGFLLCKMGVMLAQQQDQEADWGGGASSPCGSCPEPSTQVPARCPCPCASPAWSWRERAERGSPAEQKPLPLRGLRWST